MNKRKRVADQKHRRRIKRYEEKAKLEAASAGGVRRAARRITPAEPRRPRRPAPPPVQAAPRQPEA